MKVTFQTADLIRALDTVQRAAQVKVSSNTNNGFLITARDGFAEFQANDYSLGIKTKIPADVADEGTVVIAAPQLLSTVKMMPQQAVVMEQEKGQTQIALTAGSYKTNFPTRQASEFPEVREMENTFHAKMSGKDFCDMVSSVSFAASTDAKSPIFTGILCEIGGEMIAMAATNSHRLAARDATLSETATGTGRLIVPSYVLAEAARLLAGEEETPVEISWASKHAAFTFGNTFIMTTLINGEYPDYKRVIPTTFDLNAEVNLKEFSDAVRFVSPISKDMNYKTVNFKFADGAVQVFEEDPDIGRAETSVAAKLDGADIAITFNCTYVEDILKHSKGETIILHVKKNGPMLVEQEEEKAYRYVVTPMRGR